MITLAPFDPLLRFAEIERLIAKIYYRFSHLFLTRQDLRDFWWEMAREEEQHASILGACRDLILNYEDESLDPMISSDSADRASRSTAVPSRPRYTDARRRGCFQNCARNRKLRDRCDLRQIVAIGRPAHRQNHGEFGRSRRGAKTKTKDRTAPLLFRSGAYSGGRETLSPSSNSHLLDTFIARFYLADGVLPAFRKERIRAQNNANRVTCR